MCKLLFDIFDLTDDIRFVKDVLANLGNVWKMIQIINERTKCLWHIDTKISAFEMLKFQFELIKLFCIVFCRSFKKNICTKRDIECDGGGGSSSQEKRQGLFLFWKCTWTSQTIGQLKKLSTTTKAFNSLGWIGWVDKVISLQ